MYNMRGLQTDVDYLSQVATAGWRIYPSDLPLLSKYQWFPYDAALTKFRMSLIEKEGDSYIEGSTLSGIYNYNGRDHTVRIREHNGLEIEFEGGDILRYQDGKIYITSSRGFFSIEYDGTLKMRFPTYKGSYRCSVKSTKVKITWTNK
jgi:hypothetical protein